MPKSNPRVKALRERRADLLNPLLRKEYAVTAHEDKLIKRFIQDMRTDGYVHSTPIGSMRR